MGCRSMGNMRCRNFENDEVVFFGSKGIQDVIAEYQKIDLKETTQIEGTKSGQSFKIVGTDEVESTIDFYDAYGKLTYQISTNNLPLDTLPNVPYIDENYQCEWNKSLAEVNSMLTGGVIKCTVNSLKKRIGFNLVPTDCYLTRIVPIEKWEAKDYYFCITNKNATSISVGIQQPDNTYTIITTYITLTANQSKEIQVTFTEDTYGDIYIIVPDGSEIYVGGNIDSDTRNLFDVNPIYTEQDVEYFEANTNSQYNVAEVRLGKNAWIGDGAFEQYHLYFPLKKVVIPEEQTSIGNYAFGGSAVENVNIPDSVLNQYVGVLTPAMEVFASSKIKTVVSGEGVEVFGWDGFYECEQLETVILGSNTVAIDTEEYYGCIALKKLQIPPSIVWIGNNAFEGSGLTTLVIPKDNFEELTFQSFAGMRYLQRLETPLCNVDETNNYIGRIFEATTQSADVPEGYTKIQQGTYYYLIPSNLTNLKITNGYYNNGAIVHEIPANNCENMTTLTSVTIGADITTINAQAFKNCTNLRFVSIENENCTIDPTAFDGCDNLIGITHGKEEMQFVLNTIDDTNTEVGSQAIVMTNGTYEGILNAPLSSITVSDISAYKKLTLYLYRLTESKKANNFVDEQDAVASALNQQLRVIKGELWYKMNYGLPLFDKVASKIQMDTVILNIVNDHLDVTSVENFNSYVTGSTYRCSMIVKTKYGSIAISI